MCPKEREQAEPEISLLHQNNFLIFVQLQAIIVIGKMLSAVML